MQTLLALTDSIAFPSGAISKNLTDIYVDSLTSGVLTKNQRSVIQDRLNNQNLSYQERICLDRLMYCVRQGRVTVGS